RLAFHHHMGTVVETEAEIDRLMAMTGDSVGLLLDTGHLAFARANPAVVARRHERRINHVHCKDIRDDVLAWVRAGDVSFLDAVLDAAAAYVQGCGLLPLRVAKAAVTGAVITPFRAVFIEVENSPELREFRERLRDIVGAPALIPPHISLLYTLDRDSQAPRPDFDAAMLNAIAARCTDEIDDTHFTLGRPVVNNSGV